MDQLLSVAQTISPIGIIAILAIIIYQLIKANGIVNFFIPKNENDNESKKSQGYLSIKELLELLTDQNESLLENHFKHEIPEMVKSLGRIERSQEKMLDILNDIRVNTKK